DLSLSVLLFFPVTYLAWMTVEQGPSALILQEGASSTLKCNFSQTAGSMQWFRQHSGGGTQLLIYIRSSMATKEDQRLIVLLNEMAKHLSLYIRDTQPEGSAVYFCAASTHCFPGGGGVGSLLSGEPDAGLNPRTLGS
uniref:Ig-like domain-containing protein n=1 Tax=Neovison vison TaxID=452646 RepID=A0A8C7C518_NEOVI